MLSNEKTAWIGVVVVCAWQSIAMNTIIYITGLQTVPKMFMRRISRRGDRMEEI